MNNVYFCNNTTPIAMKKLYLILVLTVAIVMSGCTSEDLLNESLMPVSGQEYRSVDSRIDPAQAVLIADSIMRMGWPESRCMALSRFDYVTSCPKGRSVNADTLAYIINYGDGDGFVVVSADNRVEPVLAYSHNNNFSLDNQLAKTQFLDRIDNYISAARTVSAPVKAPVDPAYVYQMEPITKIMLGQREPFNKYANEGVGCSTLIGCVGIATAYMMTYSRDSVRYDDEIYHLKSIRRGYSMAPQKVRPGGNFGFISANEPLYNREQAEDYMYKMLYSVCVKVKTKFYGTEDNTNGSFASSYDARAFLLNTLKLEVTSFLAFDASDIIDLLSDKNIVYISGRHINPEFGGHAWTCDGYQYMTRADNDTKYNMYLHFNWGWNGECNGYFNGDVFIAKPGQEYQNATYFGVKIEI